MCRIDIGTKQLQTYAPKAGGGAGDMFSPIIWFGDNIANVPQYLGEGVMFLCV